jgi:thiosulfate/3-mercaptopyruvate sulfurtransferase
MSYTRPEALVSTEWLAAHLNDPAVVVLDASWFLPGQGDGHAEYAKTHIPGAAFFDIDAVADPSTSLPHMLPDAAGFAHAVGALGVGNDSHVVIYDRALLSSAARVWWEFRAMGHKRVSVLDGGLRKWIAEGRKVDAAPVTPQPKPYTAHPDAALVRSLGQMKSNLASHREQVLDARPTSRFKGAEAEPRPGLKGGHIPGSLNLPSSEIVDAKAATMIDADALASKFRGAGIDMAQPIVTTCGSGVTASLLALGLYLIGKDAAVYDGSWSEWGARTDVPIET